MHPMASNFSEDRFFIKDVIKEHTQDVRAVTPSSLPNGGFYTGSRDLLVKLWKPAETKSYSVAKVFTGPTNYVSSLCTLPPGDDFPSGLVLAGCHDCAIYGFCALSQTPIMKLMGHSNVVCALSSGEGMFVSGSWDKTVRVWSGQQCLHVLTGHLQAVWAVQVFPIQNLIITGSADNTIRVWRNGMCENTFYGHTDCVRGLAITKYLNILSSSNDGTVREWDINGNNLNVFQCHDNYIYGFTLLKNGIDFATCGEDEFVKIWQQNGQCSQSLRIKSKTLWSIATIAQGDLVIGCSDGTVCIIGEKETTDMEGGDTAQSRIDGPMNLELRHSIKKGYLEVFVTIEGKEYLFNVHETEDPFDASLKFVITNSLSPEHIPSLMQCVYSQRGGKVHIRLPFPNKFFPSKTYVSYLQGNIDGLRSKLIEFNDQAPEPRKIPPEKVENLVQVALIPDDVSEEQMQYLDLVITWNEDHLFPALDLLRLSLKCKGIGERIANQNFINHLLDILSNSKKDVNRTLVIKVFCNLFSIEEGENMMMEFQAKICDSAKESIYFSINCHKATASLFLNYAIAGFKQLALDVDQYCMNIMEMLRVITYPDSLYKLFVAIGTVCICNKAVFENFCALNLNDALLECSKSLDKDSDAMSVLQILMESFQDTN